MTKLRRPGAALAFLAFSLFLDSLAQSISFPILPRLAQSLLGGDTAAAARWVGWLEVGWAAPQFFAAPLLGLLSDRIGRRPVIIASAFGVGAELVLNALAPNIWWLLAGRMFCGFTCGAQAAAMAYVADITAPEQRARVFGWMNAALWSAIIVGPAMGGVLAGISIRAPFWAAAGVAFAAGAYGLVALPPSPGPRARFDWRKASPWHAIDLLARPALVPLAVALTLMWLAFQGKDNMIVLYTAARYGWTPLVFGLFAGALAAGVIAVQAGAVGPLTRRFGERRVLIGGLALQALGMLGIGLSPTGLGFWLANVPIVLGAVATPAIQALMSQRAGADEQGRLQGALSSVSSFACVVAPVGFTQLFAATLRLGPAWSGATILVGAAFTVIALALVAATRAKA